MSSLACPASEGHQGLSQQQAQDLPCEASGRTNTVLDPNGRPHVYICMHTTNTFTPYINTHTDTTAHTSCTNAMHTHTHTSLYTHKHRCANVHM